MNHSYQHIPHPHGSYTLPTMGHPPLAQSASYPSHIHHISSQNHGAVHNGTGLPNHQPHPHPPQADYRPYHHSARPLIVSSTPSPSYPQHYAHVMPPVPTAYYRPHQMHSSMPSHYYTQNDFHPASSDVLSPASLVQETSKSNPPSSPAQSAELVDDAGEIRYETPTTSASSIPPSPMTVGVIEDPKQRFRPPLPWYSAPTEVFPARRPRIHKRPIVNPKIVNAGTDKSIPSTTYTRSLENNGPDSITDTPKPHKFMYSEVKDSKASQEPSVAENLNLEASLDSTQRSVHLILPQIEAKIPAKPIQYIPVIPAIPAITTNSTQKQMQKTPDTRAISTTEQPPPVNIEIRDEKSDMAENSTPENIVSAAPKSWADLVRPKMGVATGTGSLGVATVKGVSGTGLVLDKHTLSLAEVLHSFQVPMPNDLHGEWMPPMLEPRGLVNTGNMCFMNSILQALIFCGPFYFFLDSISRHVAHNFKSETPLVDAMILFMREFHHLQSKGSIITGKPNVEIALAGDPFVPEYVYEAVRGLKRFSSMRRGHQQDAEEFLNFFLDVLHEESVAAMRSLHRTMTPDPNSAEILPSDLSDHHDDNSGWLEVGHKQKAAITRNIGHISGISPITKIFGGQLRSELRISGQRSSVTREPYQSIQLDIQGSQVNDIIDAIRQLSTPEVLQSGDFKSARGTTVSATKQIFIDSLPPVLILHLKRFQYDNTGGTQKIWKVIGYPTELEMPNEVLSPSSRSSSRHVKYKLTSVVYHHGKSATNGHYTVDVRRQDGWIRIDDTIVKRISEKDVVIKTNQINEEIRKKDESDEHDWKEVRFTVKTNGKGSVSNGVSSKDDKVAYLLFYEMT